MGVNPLRLGIFGALQDVQRQRAERAARQREAGERLEDRVAQKAMRDLQKRTLEQALNAPKVFKPRTTRSANIGGTRVEEEFNEPTGKWTPTDYVPWEEPAKPKEPPQTIPPGVGLRQPDGSYAVPVRATPKAATVRKATDKEQLGAFMLEGATRAVKTLSGYAAPAKSAVRLVPGLGNYGLSEADQVAQQAAETLHDAYLRITTGATIAPDELRRAALQYIPQPGDKLKVLRAKAIRRAEVLRSIRRLAAPALAAAQAGGGVDEELADTSGDDDEEYQEFLRQTGRKP